MARHVPLDIALSVISHVTDKDTLSTLSLTNKTLSKEAVKYLYRDIDERDNETLHLLFIGTLLSNPSLALLVRSYAIITVSTTDYEPGGSEEEDLEAVAKSCSSQKYEYIWALLPKALSLMSNLKVLSFNDRRQESCAPHLLRDSYAFRLKELEWDCGEEGDEISKFLTVQTELEVLSVTLAPEFDLQIQTSVCKRLVQLSGNMTTLLQFLPGRRTITRVQWSPYFDDVKDGLALLGSEWERVTHFSITRGSIFRQKLSPILNGLFSSLVALAMDDLYHVSGPAFGTVGETDEVIRKRSQPSIHFLSSDL